MVKKQKLEVEIERISTLIEKWSLKLDEDEPQPRGRRVINKKDEIIPAGRILVQAWRNRRGKLEEVRRARTTSGTLDHHNPQVEKEIGPEGRIGLTVEKDETRTCLSITEEHFGTNTTNSGIRTSRSPVKDLITSFEKLQQTENVKITSFRNKKNPETSTSPECFQLGRVKKLAETFSSIVRIKLFLEVEYLHPVERFRQN